MFTETELIDAMRHAASRADDLDRPRTDQPSPGRRRWSRVALPAAAAAVVLALATGAVLLERDGDPRSPAAGRSGVASVSPTPATSSPSATHPPDAHVPAELSGIIDHVQVGTSRLVNWELGGNGDAAKGSSDVELPLADPTKSLTLDIVGPQAGLDAARIPRGHPVRIAGTTGYYSSFKLFPLDASTGASSDKYLHHWTIAFRTPDGDWAFAHIEKSGHGYSADDVSVNDPAAIVAAYDKLRATYVSGRSTLPFRTGYLPRGLHVDQVFFATGDPGLTGVYLTSGRKTIDLQLAPVGSGASVGGSSCFSACGHAEATVGRYRVAVDVTGFDASTARRIVRTLTVTAKPNDPSTYWTLADALG